MALPPLGRLGQWEYVVGPLRCKAGPPTHPDTSGSRGWASTGVENALTQQGFKDKKIVVVVVGLTLFQKIFPNIFTFRLNMNARLWKISENILWIIVSPIKHC